MTEIHDIEILWEYFILFLLISFPSFYVYFIVSHAIVSCNKKILSILSIICLAEMELSPTKIMIVYVVYKSSLQIFGINFLLISMTLNTFCCHFLVICRLHTTNWVPPIRNACRVQSSACDVLYLRKHLFC